MVSGKKGCKALADTSNLQEEIIKKPALPKPDSSTPVTKKRNISKVLDVPVNVPLQDNKSIDILEILKTAVCDFDQSIIALGSSRSYKNSNHLYVNSEHYIKVLRESTYDAEMYQVLKSDNPQLEALLELLAMASISKLEGHFEQVFKYEKQLHPQEIWIIHFSRKDYVVTNLY
ncbi:P-loop containing nucleoside triphosphate hydrolase protein [Rhizophagus clarus]|uniref:P-loop containing nucleoside triphosphate hydrolase protein n=1 Tax=Rhizophagus clarus TaxID=94130 RepID=A0A8H3LGP7_9GLOM|nr:P-loop containing nucleoside triphosphate hydrolase protein [Rhizophagus clarus]